MSNKEEINNNNIESASVQYLRALTKTFTGIEKPIKNEKIPENLNELIAELHKVFDSDHVNIEYVNHLLLGYKSNPLEWKKFAKFDRYRYTRNLVDAGNGKFNLMIICWGEGHGSAIHDHSDSHCFMKMLQGELSEIRYAWPSDDINEIDQNTACNGQTDDEYESQYDKDSLKETGRGNMALNEVRYINDSMGLHRVENASHTDVAVSLHLYCPPFDSCKIFNKNTGKPTKCQVTFWSKFGGKRDKTATVAIIPEDN